MGGAGRGGGGGGGLGRGCGGAAEGLRSGGAFKGCLSVTSQVYGSARVIHSIPKKNDAYI